MPPLKTKQQRAEEQKASNARERQIAKQYFQAGPSISNLYNAFMHWYNSVPFLGGQPETGNVYITGEAPNPAVRSPKSIIQPIKQISKANAAKITAREWTAAQDAAIARGDMAEAQRLRDLHFKTKAPNTKYVTEEGLPKVATHGTNKQFNSFELEGPDIVHRDPGDFGYGHYFYPWDGKSSYGNRQIRAYLNMERPYSGDWSRNFNRSSYEEKRMLYDMIQARNYGLTNMTTRQMFDEINKLRTADGVIAVSPYSKKPLEVVVPKGEQIKSADAVTYDNNGVRIPLGERDNFSINDLRYMLVPPVGVGIEYGLYNTYNR